MGKLLGFDFSIEYKAGSTNTMADALSLHDTEEAAVLAISGQRFDFIDRLRQAHYQDYALITIKGTSPPISTRPLGLSLMGWWPSRGASTFHLVPLYSRNCSPKCRTTAMRASSTPCAACATTSIHPICTVWFRTTSRLAPLVNVTNQSTYI